MSTRLTVEELIAAATTLSPQDRQRLIQALTRQATEEKRRITELKGLGKEVWQGRDAQEYVYAERDSWEGERRLATLYDEFAKEDREHAEEGMSDYANALMKEDSQ